MIFEMDVTSKRIDVKQIPVHYQHPSIRNKVEKRDHVGHTWYRYGIALQLLSISGRRELP